MQKNFFEVQKSNRSLNDLSVTDNIIQEAGLQQFMIQTFTWMTVGLALTGLSSFLTMNSQTMVRLIFGNPLVFIGLIIAEFALVIAFGVSLRKQVSTSKLLGMFLTYSILNGLTLSSILMAYTASSVSQAFFIAAGTFGGISLFGYVTKKDMTGLGQFVGMGLWGLILALVINIFLKSTVLDLAISVIGVFIFVGLTAYDTQKLKSYYYHYSADEVALKRVSLGGALTLYLDFINLFLYMLRFVGNRK